MSSNREWDQGKSWENRGLEGYGRSREDDEYYGDGKRRKYNHGGYKDTYGSANDTAFNYDHESYDAADAEFAYPTTNQDDRSFRDRNTFQPRKRHVASEPSPHVIFLGLDLDFTEADLNNFLKDLGFVIETVTIIRDRNTGHSKGFGFAQFRTMEEARTFVGPNFPFISVPPPASHGASAATAYKRAQDTGAELPGKRVKIDYSQSASAAGHGRRGPQFANDGTRDIGNTQSPVLLFRGLDVLSGPAAIAQAMQSCGGQGKGGAKGMKRVILIKDGVTMASWGFAFVEFVDVQCASAALAATMSPQIHPNGFRISDRPVAGSFAHPYSFQPIQDSVYQDESCIPSSLNLGGIEGTFVKYWDEAATVAVMEFEIDPAAQQEAYGSGTKKEKEKKKKTNATVPIATGPSTLPLSKKPVTLSLNKAANTAKPIPVPTVNQAAVIFASNEENESEAAEATDGKASIPVDDKAKQGHKVPPMIASKKVVNNINKWNQAQDGLGETSKDIVEPATNSAIRQSDSPDAENEFEYSDLKAMTCLLCSRQFKSVDQLKRHNKESDLHKRNLKDSNLRQVARQKASVAKEKEKTQDAEGAPSKPTTQYRDRASERRTLFNQPDVPVLDALAPSKSGTNTKRAEGPPPPPSPPPAPVAPAKDDNNIGNKLLKMMGWTEGTGLGTEGEGRVEPIQTNIYASGAGLGASKGREVGKYQDGYSGYVQMTRDVARERYESGLR